YAESFDRFMRDYLTVQSQSGAIPRVDRVYESFKAYRVKSVPDKPIMALIAEIHGYAHNYTHLAFGHEPDGLLNEALSDIRELEAGVTYPMLLEVYDDYRKQLLSRDDFIAIIRLAESYVFRRAICGIPTNSLNKTFATIMREVDKTHYRQSVEAAFFSMGSYKRFPHDDEFGTQFMAKDIYRFQRRNYVLRKLETYERKEIVKVENLTIEHI